jgi:hypothetical protein
MNREGLRCRPKYVFYLFLFTLLTANYRYTTDVEDNNNRGLRCVSSPGTLYIYIYNSTNDSFTDIYVYGHYHHHHGHNEWGGTTTAGVWRSNNNNRETMMNRGGARRFRLGK